MQKNSGTVQDEDNNISRLSVYRVIMALPTNEMRGSAEIFLERERLKKDQWLVDYVQMFVKNIQRMISKESLLWNDAFNDI